MFNGFFVFGVYRKCDVETNCKGELLGCYKGELQFTPTLDKTLNLYT